MSSHASRSHDGSELELGEGPLRNWTRALGAARPKLDTYFVLKGSDDMRSEDEYAPSPEDFDRDDGSESDSWRTRSGSEGDLGGKVLGGAFLRCSDDRCEKDAWENDSFDLLCYDPFGEM